MKNRLQLIFTALLFAILSNSAWALSKSITLDFDNAHIKGQNVLMLKKALKAQYPGLDIRHYDLDKVILVGKSRKGRGQASLRVADWTSPSKRIAGTPRDFWGDNPWSNSEVVFRNRGYKDQGPWQLNLKGNFKVNKVLMVLRDQQTVSQRWWKPADKWTTRDEDNRRYQPEKRHHWGHS